MVDRSPAALANLLLALPSADRARIAQLLLASLEEHDPGAVLAWDAEIDRRAAELESGQVQAIPADEVFDEVGRRLQDRAGVLRRNMDTPTLLQMRTPIFDFSHLTPDERIELAEQLWDSLEPSQVGLSAEQAAELRRRREALEADGNIGRPWREVLDEIESDDA